MRGLLRSAPAVAITTLAGLAGLTGCSNDDPADPGELLNTVFVGDSITSGVSSATMGPDDEYSWVTYALTDDRTPWRLDSKVSEFGRTLGEMSAVFEDEVVARDPEAVVIMGGTNDALRQLPPEQSATALAAMIAAAQEAGAEVWVVGPPPLDQAYGRPLEPYVEAVRVTAEEADVPFVDLSSELLGDDGRWLPGLSEDGVHPTVEGAEELADLVLDEFGR